MSHKNRHGLRGLAALAVAAVASIGLVAPASSAPIIDGDTLGSVTVHKYERPETPTGLPANGTEQEVTLPPIEGIEFTLQQVNTIDLSSNSGWLAANALSGVFDAADPVDSITGAGYTLGAPTEQTTDEDGETTFDGLPVGLYLITETGFPAGVTPSAPFLVSVPLTDPDTTDTWLYDVHVYPKNSVDTIEMTVSDLDSIQLGDTVTWTILADIPNEAVITGYRIVDALDLRLDYVGTVVTLEDGTPIILGTHYTIVFDEDANTVTVEFLPAGLELLAANNTTRVEVIITTTVNEVGEIANQATLYPNAASFDWEEGDPGAPPVTSPIETSWGEMTLAKVDEDGDALTGAEFSVFASEADALAGTNALVFAGESVFPVDAGGLLTVSGLRYSSWADGVTVAAGDPGYRTYYLVEVGAPEGYELLAEPVPFVIDASTTAAGVDYTIENVPSNSGFDLPFTGGTGAALIYLAGALLAAGALVLGIRSRRQLAS